MTVLTISAGRRVTSNCCRLGSSVSVKRCAKEFGGGGMGGNLRGPPVSFCLFASSKPSVGSAGRFWAVDSMNIVARDCCNRIRYVWIFCSSGWFGHVRKTHRKRALVVLSIDRTMTISRGVIGELTCLIGLKFKMAETILVDIGGLVRIRTAKQFSVASMTMGFLSWVSSLLA